MRNVFHFSAASDLRTSRLRVPQSQSWSVDVEWYLFVSFVFIFTLYMWL
jgi:hypothetical protein